MKSWYISYLVQDGEYESLEERVIQAEVQKLNNKADGNIIIDIIYETTDDAMI